MKTISNQKLLLCLFFLFAGFAAQTKEYTLSSPDSKIVVKISAGNEITWAVTYNNEVLLLPGKISLELGNGKILGNGVKVRKASPFAVNDVINVPVPVKNRQIAEIYNQLKLEIDGNYSVVFRAYNDGVAYRFETAFPDNNVELVNEIAEFNFPANFQTAWPSTGAGFGMMRREATAESKPGFGSKNPESGRRGFGAPGGMPGGAPGAAMPQGGMPPAGGFPMRERSPFTNSFEYIFGDSLVASVKETAGLPIYISTEKGTKMVLVESDVYDYPNMFIKGTGTNSMVAAFPPVVLKADVSGSPSGGNAETAKYIAKTKGTRTFPWRAVIISPDDKGLLENELVYKLATPAAFDASWVKPGQVTWEWYNATNIYGVDFESGINTPTYKYYIDFAAKYGIPYLLIDAGWLNNDAVDVPAVINYGQQKQVDVLLWVAWTDMFGKVGEQLDKFAAWGAKGVKMDYMNRADQQMVNFYEEMAVETAKRKLLLDFHGAYKPVGLNRKYPNVMNYEGVKGMEHNKMGSTDVTPSHDVTLLFTRMVAGPMDYTPGAVVTMAYGNFKNLSSEPMSQGTRAHQAAMYVMYDSPIQMLSDNPTLYMRDEPFLKYLTQIPTVWDKTIGIDGKIGQYAIMARKNGDNWYIGAMTDWSERNIEVSLNFLDGKKYKAEIFQDGVNANKRGIDYKIVSKEVTSTDQLKIEMKQGGGWVAILTPVN